MGIWFAQLLNNLSLGFETVLFDTTLPTTMVIFQVKTIKERAQALTKTGKLTNEGGMFCFLGAMTETSKDLLHTCRIFCKIKANERKEREDGNQAKEMLLLDKAEEVFLKFKEEKLVLDKLSTSDLQKSICLLYCVNKRGIATWYPTATRAR